MLMQMPPFKRNGQMLGHAHFNPDDGSRYVTHEWQGGRVIRVDAMLLPPLPFDPVGSRVSLGREEMLEAVRLRVLWRHFEMNCYDCVPDDARAYIEVVITRLFIALNHIEIGIARFMHRRGWISTKPGYIFQWRDALPFTLMRWR